MLQLFVPQSKVQKDRKLMRETDFRVAKYSRRGIILNFFAYLLCLSVGSFFELAQQLAIILTIGLLLITIVRSYFLFRFDALYSRAPARWRNQYFIASFIGAAWWSLILVSVTSVVGMQNETPLLWLYTLIFYSTTANAFVPYRQFLTYYQFIGQIPTAAAAILLGTVEGYMYGAMMLVYFLMSYHQGRGMAEAYWNRLEVNYALKQKARDLEVEKRDTQAAVELNNEFMTNLGHEFRTSLNDVIGALSLLEDSDLEKKQRELLTLAEKASERQLDLVNNVMDFSRIATKELVLDNNIFNLRRHLETVIDELAVEAHQQGVELNYIVAPEIPVRVRGDSVRLGQILMHLTSNAIKFSEQGEVIVEAGFNHTSEQSGELNVTVRDEGSGILAAGGEALFDAFAKVETTQAGTGLGLAICKGLAECMGGDAGMINEPGKGTRLWLKINLQLAGKQSKSINVNPKLKGRRCLIVDAPEKVVGSTMKELVAWGVIAESVPSGDQAIQRLDDALKSEHPFDIILIYNPLQSMKGFEFSKQLCADKNFHSLKQIIAISKTQSSTEEMQQYLDTCSQIVTVHKPVLSHQLHEVLNYLLFNTSCHSRFDLDVVHDHGQGVGHRVLLVEDHRVNQMVAAGMLKKLGYSVVIANNGREALKFFDEERFDLVLMDCQMPEMDGYMATRELRNREMQDTDQPHVPVIAMTAHAAEGDQARCLAAGMDDYLPKPVRYDELENRLKRWLGVGETYSEGLIDNRTKAEDSSSG